MNDDLLSKEALPKENIDKIKVSSAEIVVHGTRERPYYEIKYFDLSDNEMHIGYSSYNLDFVFEYLEKYFEIVNEKRNSEQNQDQISGDLISRKALLKSGSRISEYDVDNFPITIPIKDVKEIIRKSPTVFDQGKVIEELKRRRDCYDMNEEPLNAIGSKEYIRECADIREHKGKWIAYDEAIKVVEKGGTE